MTSAISTNAHYNLLLDAEEASSLQYTYGVSPDGETDETRFIMSRKGDEVQPALITAMEAKMGGIDDNNDDENCPEALYLNGVNLSNCLTFFSFLRFIGGEAVRVQRE